MKGKFRTPLWVIPALALVMVLGAFAVLASVNHFSAGPAEASIKDVGKDLSPNVDLEKLTEPLQTPLGTMATAVSTASAVVSPLDPGRPSRLTVTFTTSGTGQLNPGDEIIITLEDDFQVPATVDRNQVSLRSSAVTGAPGFANQTVAPDGVRLDFVGAENDEAEITLQVPDMNAEDGSGVNAISPGATVTVIFLQTAGILNPAEAGNYDVRIATTADQDELALGNEVIIPLRVEMSSDSDPRGTELTLLALGVEGGGSVTFWLDTNGNGVREGTERDLSGCTGIEAERNDTATCILTITNPPFTPGQNPSDTTCQVADLNTAAFSCNFINVLDSEGRTTDFPFQDPVTKATRTLSQGVVNRQAFNLDPTVGIAPRDANVGDTVTISLFDYPAGAVDLILINNLNVTPPGLPSVSGSGEVSFGFRVPGVAPNCIPAAAGGAPGAPCTGTTPNINPDAGGRIPTGVRRIDVRAGGVQEDSTVSVGGANLTLSRQTVIANQDLTISGNGFSEGTGICILEGQITLSDVPLKIDEDDLDCPTGTGILLTSGGTFTATVRVHNMAGQIPTALLTEAVHELKVIDANGAEGTLQVTIPERTIEVTPASARPRDVVTIIGTGFVGDNPDGISESVDVEYRCGNDTRTTTADTDVSGNWRETLRIPTNCAIPSTNTITARIRAAGVDTGVVETITHEIPDSLVRVEPVRGPSGTMVTVSGEGFRTFETVESIEFGGRGTLGGRTVNTDANGNFSIPDVVVPGLDPGIHSVKVEVGTGVQRSSASTSYEVLEAGVEGVPSDVTAAVAPLADNLVRVFHFNNVTKEWTFFDPRPEFEVANTLNELVEGQPVWIRVNQGQQVDLNNQARNLTCVNPGTPEEDCWNLIVW